MKYNEKSQQIQIINHPFSELRRISLAVVSAIVLTFLALPGKAGEILVNPSFDTAPLFAPGSWTQHASETWSMGPGTAADLTAVKLIHTGADDLWMQGLYGNGQGGPQTSYAAQDFATIPGNTYSAYAWYSAYTYCTSHIGGDDGSDSPGGCGLYAADGSGNEDGWVEVRFYNSGNVLLAVYTSLIVTPAFVGTASGTTYNGTLPTVTNSLGNIYLAWEQFFVTNQYDPTTFAPNADPSAVGTITNTLGSGQHITAPPGAVSGEFRINLYQAAYEAGAPFWDDANLTLVGGPSPSIIGDLSPDGTKFFNGASTSFTFNVTSASAGGAALPTNPTNGIQVVVNGVNKSASLQFGGTPTNLNVTLPGLASNQIYTISIAVSNSLGLTSGTAVTFDTFATNNFIVSAEDYDFTNGMYIEDPIPTSAPASNSYTGLAGVLGVDVSTYDGTGVLPGGAAQLIRSDGYTAMQKASDIQLPLYLAQDNPNVYNVQIAYNNGGNWLNYTRVYPTGNYLVYLRYNDGNADDAESLNLLTSGYGTPTQTTTNLGEFISAGTGASYAWVPLTDTYGNKIIVNLSAGTNTLQLLSGNGVVGGVENFVDFMFVSAGTGIPPVINNLSPNNINPPINSDIFLSVTNITFSVSSAFSTIPSNNIQVLANGINLSPGETFTGNNTNWDVSIPCPQNELITLVINATDANGLSNSISETFDTFTQSNMMIEAVDFDFNGGQFIDDPVPTAPLFTATNSYFDGGINETNAAVVNVDYYGFSDGGGEAWPYRPLDTDVGQEPTTDFLREKFIAIGASDYDMGYWNGGFWENYTRTFPANAYNVYGRLAGGAGPFNNTTMELVTSGAGTTNQTTQLLGSFADANAAGWETWHWVPMREANGALSKVSLGGVKTLKVTSGNNLNGHFFMFVPLPSVNLGASRSGSSIQIKYQSQAGSLYTVLYNSSLTGGSWQPLAPAAVGDGTVKTVTDVVGPTQRFYIVLIQ
jgi:hypothetical protein